MTYTVTAPYRDYTLRVEARTEETVTVNVDTTEFFILMETGDYILMETGDYIYYEEANVDAESPLLHAQHRDYSVTALQVD